MKSRPDKTILWIDDNASILRPIFYPLEKQGCQILVAHDNDEALELITRHSEKIDLVIQDGMRPPGRCLEDLGINSINNSVEFCNRFIVEKLPDVPNIFFSVRSDEKFLDTINSLNAYYVSKPIRPSELSTLIISILTEKKKVYSTSDVNTQVELFRLDLTEVNEALINYLAKHPEYLYELDPRKFEELVAKILEDEGYEVTLTPSTRDGGKDIYALFKSQLGHVLTLVECKRYAKDRPVGVEIVRSLYGVKVAERANMGVVVTTSFFTNAARDFNRQVGYELSLRDYNNLVEWLRSYQVDPNNVFKIRT